MSSDKEGSTQSWDVDDRERKCPGVAALGLFGVLAWVFVSADFNAAFDGPASGFVGDAGITESIGYAMFNIQAPDAIASEGFLVAFIVIAVVLDAALDGAVMLASREAEGTLTTALRSDAAERETEQVPATDGGERIADSASGTRESAADDPTADESTEADRRAEEVDD
jgi:NADH-quinone oxidoreductase subunit J